MIAAFPDNAINTEIKARLHNAGVDGKTFPLFTGRATNSKAKQFFLISTQLNDPNFNKCGDGWENSTEIQIIVRLNKNSGSKALLNNATQEVLTQLSDFSLPGSTGLTVNKIQLSTPNEVVLTEGNEIIYQKIIRMETLIS
nr:hypothetical protein [uncultured Allomuricauda sp.]